MKKKTIEYTDEPIYAKVIPDFLPRPEDLVLKRSTVKVTLALTPHTIEFFKNEAKINHTQYQKMIRNLLDQYVLLIQADKRAAKKRRITRVSRKDKNLDDSQTT